MLCDEEMILRSIDGKTLCIAYAGREALGRRECLIRLIRVIAPDTAARLEIRTRVDARRFRRAILRLAGIGCGCDVDVQGTAGIDRERMHRMAGGKRQYRHDSHR